MGILGLGLSRSCGGLGYRALGAVGWCCVLGGVDDRCAGRRRRSLLGVALRRDLVEVLVVIQEDSAE